MALGVDEQTKSKLAPYANGNSNNLHMTLYRNTKRKSLNYFFDITIPLDKRVTIGPDYNVVVFRKSCPFLVLIPQKVSEYYELKKNVKKNFSKYLEGVLQEEILSYCMDSLPYLLSGNRNRTPHVTLRKNFNKSNLSSFRKKFLSSQMSSENLYFDKLKVVLR